MRKFSLVVIAAMLLGTGNVLANDLDGVEPSESLTSQISLLLSDCDFSEVENDLTAQVRFTLNEAGEIVVLSVATDFEQMERFVKNRLNYKKVDLTKVEEGKIYTVPVRVTA